MIGTLTWAKNHQIEKVKEGSYQKPQIQADELNSWIPSPEKLFRSSRKQTQEKLQFYNMANLINT